MTKFSSLILFTLLCCFNTVFSQPGEHSDDWTENISYGGNLGLTFGSQTIVNVSPRIGYWVSDNFVPGIGGTYMYFKDNNSNFSEKRYGGSLFGRYFLQENIFAHLEYEALNLTVFSVSRDFQLIEERQWIGSLMAGGGYYMDGFTISFVYILNHDPDTSPYGTSPIVVSAGVMF